MKKILGLVISISFVFLLVICTGTQIVKAPSEKTNNSDSLNMYINIDYDDGSSYALMSSGTVKYDEKYDNYEIYIDNPTLLTFKISEKLYPGGKGVVSGEKINEIISSIEKILLENQIDESTQKSLENILQQLESIPLSVGERESV